VQRFSIADTGLRVFKLIKYAIENRITRFAAPQFLVADSGLRDFKLIKYAIENRITRFAAQR